MVTTDKRKKLVRKDLLTPQEFADRLKVDRERVFKWIQRGHIAVYQVGGDSNPRYLIADDEVESAEAFMKKYPR